MPAKVLIGPWAPVQSSGPTVSRCFRPLRPARPGLAPPPLPRSGSSHLPARCSCWAGPPALAAPASAFAGPSPCPARVGSSTPGGDPAPPISPPCALAGPALPPSRPRPPLHPGWRLLPRPSLAPRPALPGSAPRHPPRPGPFRPTRPVLLLGRPFRPPSPGCPSTREGGSCLGLHWLPNLPYLGRHLCSRRGPAPPVSPPCAPVGSAPPAHPAPAVPPPGGGAAPASATAGPSPYPA